MLQTEIIAQLFEQWIGEEPQVICHAPGRVNLIGDHTDYNDGFVLPAAINFGTDIAARKRDDKVIQVFAQDCNQQQSEFHLNDIQFDSQMPWSNYVRGTLQALYKAYPSISGADIVVSGNVPQGAGLSSSASFEIALLKTMSELYQLPLDGINAALLGQAAENNFVGCSCGIMDQLISAMGKAGHAMLLDCRDLSFIDAKIPDTMALLIINSKVKRGLVDSEYNTRRQQCEAVAAHFSVAALRDVNLSQLNEAKAQLPDELFRRARHVITENERTQAALTALNNDDMLTLGQLMRASHQSMKDDFNITTPELDMLADLINNTIGDDGGARMTGGGFGGCVVAVLPNARVEYISELVLREYQAQFGVTAELYVCHATQGAFRAE